VRVYRSREDRDAYRRMLDRTEEKLAAQE